MVRWIICIGVSGGGWKMGKKVAGEGSIVVLGDKGSMNYWWG